LHQRPRLTIASSRRQLSESDSPLRNLELAFECWPRSSACQSAHRPQRMTLRSPAPRRCLQSTRERAQQAQCTLGRSRGLIPCGPTCWRFQRDGWCPARKRGALPSRRHETACAAATAAERDRGQHQSGRRAFVKQPPAIAALARGCRYSSTRVVGFGSFAGLSKENRHQRSQTTAAAGLIPLPKTLSAVTWRGAGRGAFNKSGITRGSRTRSIETGKPTRPAESLHKVWRCPCANRQQGR